MHLHRLIFVLVSLALTSRGMDSTRSLEVCCDTGYQDVSSRFFKSSSLSEAENCNNAKYAKAKMELFEHLGLDNNDNNQNPRMWPLIFNYNYKTSFSSFPFIIYVDLYVNSIRVNEKAQSLTTQVKMIIAWPNLNMTWNETTFCGIKTFAAPRNMFWTPDIVIMESIETEFGTKESPNVLLFNSGYSLSSDFLALTTTCKMDLYRFPFDTQNCNITFQSTSYSNREIKINTLSNETLIVSESKKNFHSQGEWELIDIDSIKDTITKWIGVDQLIYQITIKRRPLLYVINIIIPVFFFLVLDVISFFIDTSGADKLSFKVTLLLSISVMLLILKDTLPSTSEKIPLIGIYCCGIFCLIGISIMETIFVNYLMVKGAQKRSVETTATVSGQDDGAKDQQNPPDSVKDQKEELLYTLDRLKQILPNQSQREKTSQYLTRMARIIDNTFLVLYIITMIVFLSVIGNRWIL